MQSLQTLEKLITDHRLQSQGKHDRVMAEWLAAKCDAMCLKVRYRQLVSWHYLCHAFMAHGSGVCFSKVHKRFCIRKVLATFQTL